MEGSTFTISNLGMFGITEFNSIINQPNSAILSVGAIVEKPVVKNGHIVVGNTMMLSLACDHRTIDGATGAQFLQTLKQYIYIVLNNYKKQIQQHYKTNYKQKRIKTTI